MITIAVDAMGADHAPKPEVEGAIRAVKTLGVKVILVGREELIRRELAQHADAESLPIDVRARAYLQSNCAHCHMKWGGGNAEFKLLSTISVKEMGIVDVRPVHGDFGIKGASLLPPRTQMERLVVRLARGRQP